ncbi:hypothetical protein CERSUDRAFT_74298 [Gelatoporia subvermispora B]|uniref:Uncharacterized protein n=1 Tax=Ceriporiopsis subvermispora (strain B) TaxID=914234 RepID=M2RCX5_CERS8|nr:hypothetical protein CERSUDRAFT_74298 [Gelatoporia subvermispora B]
MTSINTSNKNDSPAPNPPSRSSSGAGDSGQDQTYPEQRHAGAVGYGPEYGKGASTGDKFEGYKTELKGKILKKPDLVQHGHEMRTGELKKKALEGGMDPFGQAKDDDPNQSESQEKQSSEQGRSDTGSGVPKSDTHQTSAHPPSVEDTSHPTEQGRQEQAATVSPEGSADAEVQRRGDQTENTRYMG